MRRSEHWDVGAYALGVLDEADAQRFEEHLAECWVCAAELESLLPVVDLLSDVDVNELTEPEPITPSGVTLERMLTLVGRERRRARYRHLASIAAAVIVTAVVLLSGTWLVGTGERDGAPSQGTVALPQPPPSTSLQGFPGPGIGGPDLPEGAERFSGIDKTSGVRADLVLEAAPWGTQVSFALSNLPGPMQCRLVVMRASGTTEILSTWSVPAAGYGTKEQPMPLLLQAATAAPRDDIERIQVQAVDEHGVARALVTVPV
ncbi:MAG TPA: zf-HC2 domain-containing protein [Micromonospora sp.]